MTNQINCKNQQPAYSGITINITNPTLNPPAQNNYYCTNPKDVAADLNQQGIVYTNQIPLASESQTNLPQAYINKGEYLEPVNNNSAKDVFSDSSNEVSDIKKENNQNIYNDSRTINQYVTQNPTDNEKQPLQSYPAEYYINNYEVTPKERSNAANEPNSNNGIITAEKADTSDNEDVGKEIITDLDERAEKERELEENGKEKKVVALTNEYIMSLENYLNNPNKDIRLMASKEIIKRFNEDRSRYNDAALNALINKMLQDPEKLIRIAAFSALSSELASGNDYTIQILNQVQQNPESDPNDVLEASEILLKRASMTEVRYVRQNNVQQVPHDVIVKAGKETQEVKE